MQAGIPRGGIVLESDWKEGANRERVTTNGPATYSKDNDDLNRVVEEEGEGREEEKKSRWKGMRKDMSWLENGETGVAPRNRREEVCGVVCVCLVPALVCGQLVRRLALGLGSG